MPQRRSAFRFAREHYLSGPCACSAPPLTLPLAQREALQISGMSHYGICALLPQFSSICTAQGGWKNTDPRATFRPQA